MKKRRISLRQNEKQIKHLRGPNGFRLCRWCQKEVQPPRKTFCNDECVHEWKLRSSTKYLREHVYIRDLGICAGCKVDTRHQKIQIEDLFKECGRNGKDPRYVTFLKNLKLTPHEAQKSLWQADHVRPVENGGGLCGLDGFQTLCTKCHKSKSAAQASYRINPKGLVGIKKVRGAGKIDDIRGIKGFKGV